VFEQQTTNVIEKNNKASLNAFKRHTLFSKIIRVFRINKTDNNLIFLDLFQGLGKNIFQSELVRF